MDGALDLLGARILIVDDQDRMCSCSSNCWARPAYVRSATKDPHEVCALHRKHGYDLILLDLQMPAWTDSP